MLGVINMEVIIMILGEMMVRMGSGRGIICLAMEEAWITITKGVG